MKILYKIIQIACLENSNKFFATGFKLWRMMKRFTLLEILSFATVICN
jgi:hypothetical protein